MHYRNEIIIPSTDNVENAVAQVMAPYNENAEDGCGNAFWDFYVIGGRFAGSKMEESLGERIDGFGAKLSELNITVSSLQWGKPELSPASQIPMVDSLWVDWFPEIGGPCPLFHHSNDQLSSNSLLPKDVCAFSETEKSMTCERVIIAGLNYDNTEIEAKFIAQKDFWTGCNHLKTEWDGTLGHCIQMYEKSLENCRAEYAEKYRVKDDHLVVTVDTHS